jgi:type II secretory pathway pseudopilin PulG
MLRTTGEKNRINLLISRKKGITLVELLVVTSLLAVVIALGVNVLAMISKTFNTEQDMAVVQQNIRTGSDFIISDVRYASEMQILPSMPSTPDSKSRYILIKNNSLVMIYNGTETVVLNGTKQGLTLALTFQRQSEKQSLGATNILCYDIRATKNVFYNISSNILIAYAKQGITNSAGINPGSVLRYKLTPNANLITYFKFANVGGHEYIGFIDQVAKTIKVVLHEGTSVTNLIATFVTDGMEVRVSNVKQLSGITSNNYTNPLTYTVVAETGPSANYTVSVVFNSPGAYVRILLPEEDPLPTEATTLTGSYEYFANGLDEEGISSTTWRELDSNGEPTIVLANDVSTYIPAGLAGHQVVFGVRPKTLSGIQSVDFIYSAPKMIFGEATNVFWEHFVNDAYYNYMSHNLLTGLLLSNAELAALGLPLNYYPNFLLRNDLGVLTKITPDDVDLVLSIKAQTFNAMTGVLMSSNILNYVDDLNTYTVTVDAEVNVGSGWAILLNGAVNQSDNNKDSGYMFQFDPGANGFCVRRVTNGTHTVQSNIGAVQVSGLSAGTGSGAPYSPIFITNGIFTWSGSNSVSNPNWYRRYRTEITIQEQCDGSLIFKVRVVDFVDDSGNLLVTPKYSNYIWFGDFGSITLNGPSEFNGVSLPGAAGGGYDAGAFIGIRTWQSGGGAFETVLREIAFSGGFEMNVVNAEFLTRSQIRIDFDQPIDSIGNLSNYHIKYRDVNVQSAVITDSDTITVTLASQASQYDYDNGSTGTLLIDRGAVKQLYAGDVLVVGGDTGIDVSKSSFVWEIVDDAAGGWSYTNFTYYINKPGYYNSTYHSSNKRNASAQYAFTGTAVEFYATKQSNGGSVNISIDGGPATTVNLRSSTTVYQQMLFSASGLTNSSHTIRIVSNDRNFDNVDYIKYYRHT